MIYYISDVHFGHDNVIQFDNREFSSVAEMDRTIIDLWNQKVSDDDDVYILGDLCFKNEKDVTWYLKQLKGKKHLILGNHDTYIKNHEEVHSYFESIDKLAYVKDGKNVCVLCHYPLAEWNKFYKGSWHIYGHIHKRVNETSFFMERRERALNAACSINHYQPVTFEELKENNRQFFLEIFREKTKDTQLPVEVCDDTWVVRTDHGVEFGSINYVLSEFAWSGLIYRYIIDGEESHEHSFEAVLYNLVTSPYTFSIPDKFKELYSPQELKYIDDILLKYKEIKQKNEIE